MTRIATAQRAIVHLRRAIEDLNDAYEDERDLYALVGAVPHRALSQITDAIHEIERVIEILGGAES
jgi:hypothetical protein